MNKILLIGKKLKTRSQKRWDILYTRTYVHAQNSPCFFSTSSAFMSFTHIVNNSVCETPSTLLSLYRLPSTKGLLRPPCYRRLQGSVFFSAIKLNFFRLLGRFVRSGYISFDLSTRIIYFLWFSEFCRFVRAGNFNFASYKNIRFP